MFTIYRLGLVFLLIYLSPIEAMETEHSHEVFDGIKIVLTEDQWAEKLSPEEFYILREKGTERAYTGLYHTSKEQGIYVCAACALPLFDSDTKYDSETGWPSFWEPITLKNIDFATDWVLLYPRTEIVCARCGSHLGHLFEDGPPPTGLRYCINSLALDFKPKTILPLD